MCCVAAWLWLLRRTVLLVSLELPLLPQVSSLAEAERTARDFDSVISLAGPAGGRGALKNHPRRLYCSFADVLDDTEGEGAPAGNEQVREILEFSAGAGLLLVHCEYGQSRSAAVAVGVAVARGITPGDAARELLQAHPIGRPFVPNEWVLTLFDRHLGCGRRLVTAGLEYTRL